MSENRFTASNGVQVWIEGDSLQTRDTRDRGMTIAPGRFVTAFREFFQNEPKPWHNAEPGEIWAITFHGTEYAVKTDFGSAFLDPREPTTAFVSLTDPAITAGRRIWPEGD